MMLHLGAEKTKTEMRRLEAIPREWRGQGLAAPPGPGGGRGGQSDCRLFSGLADHCHVHGRLIHRPHVSKVRVYLLKDTSKTAAIITMQTSVWPPLRLKNKMGEPGGLCRPGIRLGFSSGHELTVHEFEPRLGLCADREPTAWDSPSLSK